MPKPRDRDTWRGLDRIEISLMKRMSVNGLPRDYIMSFFVRPGRKISSAAPSEVMTKCPGIPIASEDDVVTYINRRLRESGEVDRQHGFSPVSSIRVREILELTQDGQSALPGFESHFAELKLEIPKDKAGRAKIAKSMAAFANNDGGYIFFGIDNSGKILGLRADENVEEFWDKLSDIVNRSFAPFFVWERGLVDVGGFLVAVIYIYSADRKPIICSTDCTNELSEGSIFFRYNRSSERIKAADLIRILEERDRAAIGRAAQEESNGAA
ncbi:ATP-binding protein [Caulobacter sp. CCH9-E1]|uniref:ATP-binding protein n=1 Tax=Caulobacter sp. CCH9-E1 TaxID=1768768 RepID=UPI0009EC66EE|nr:ATP-binding protein [Caulobacter sp. CCH9-E1]